MSDITKAELSAKLDGDVKTWWESCPAFPVNVLTNELFNRLLTAAYLAQVTKNQGLSAGSQINGYNAPAFGSTTVDTASGIFTQLMTCSISSRIPLDTQSGFSTLA